MKAEYVLFGNHSYLLENAMGKVNQSIKKKMG